MYGTRGGFVSLGHGKVDEPRFGEILGYPASLLLLQLGPPSRHDPEWTEEVMRWQQKQPTPLNTG